MAAVKTRGLGRGLSALLADAPTAEVLAQSSHIPLARIKPNSYQPRTRFSHEELTALTESIRKDGVLMPILVRPKGDAYELIAGERRWRAAGAAGLSEIPAVVRDVDDRQALELAIIENEQRDDLTAIESARAYKRLMDEFNCTQQQVAEKIGVSRVQVSNLIRLLQLPQRVMDMIEQRKLTMGQARPLVGLADDVAESLAMTCVEKRLSARQMEQEAKRAAASKLSQKQGSHGASADLLALQDELTHRLGVPVAIACKQDGSGEVRIRYAAASELSVVLQKLRT